MLHLIFEYYPYNVGAGQTDFSQSYNDTTLLYVWIKNTLSLLYKKIEIP